MNRPSFLGISLGIIEQSWAMVIDRVLPRVDQHWRNPRSSEPVKSMCSSSPFTVTLQWTLTSLLPFTSWSKNESASYSPSGHRVISSRNRRSDRSIV